MSNTTYHIRVLNTASSSDEGYEEMLKYLGLLNITISSNRVFNATIEDNSGKMFLVFTDKYIIRYKKIETHENGTRIGKRSLNFVKRDFISNIEIDDKINAIGIVDRIFWVIADNNINTERCCAGFRISCEQNDEEITKKIAKELL